MGRKIPAKKHRGVKDPLAQQAKRLQSLKGKINAPPKNPDDQPVPQSLTRLFSFQKEKNGIKDKKKKHKQIHSSSFADTSNGNKNAKNPISKMQRLPGESGRSFSLRINGALRALNDPDEQLQYPLQDIEDEDVKGSHMDELRQRRERKRRRQQQQQQRDKTLDEGDTHAHQNLSRSQRRALKLKAKKMKQTEAAGPREVVYERVRFGEVADAPPALTFNNKKLDKEHGAPRPGRRDLLLSKMLGGGATGAAGAGAGAMGAGAGAVGAAEARRRELARQDAVDAYRKHKAQLRTTNNKSR